MMDDLKCDFCSAPLPDGYSEHIYTVDGVLSGELADGRTFIDVDGEWLACYICNALIEGRQWTALVDRAVDGCFANPDTRAVAFAMGRDQVAERCAVAWATIFPDGFLKV